MTYDDASQSPDTQEHLEQFYQSGTSKEHGIEISDSDSESDERPIIQHDQQDQSRIKREPCQSSLAGLPDRQVANETSYGQNTVRSDLCDTSNNSVAVPQTTEMNIGPRTIEMNNGPQTTEVNNGAPRDRSATRDRGWLPSNDNLMESAGYLDFPNSECHASGSRQEESSALNGTSCTARAQVETSNGPQMSNESSKARARGANFTPINHFRPASLSSTQNYLSTASPVVNTTKSTPS
ncbi:hypothetical protein IL306_001754 [Fusarium sp. DS 682]|nr:hypothetical protein IL306_001754 [Fusarium sp. DS 682]